MILLPAQYIILYFLNYFQCNPSAEDSAEINSEEKSTPEIPRDAGLAALIQEADDFAQLV